MSWWLPVHVRRIIAILLLVLDLGLEPGSALAFVGIDNSEDEAVADLCRQDDFSWGRSKPCTTINEATYPARNVLSSDDGSRRGPVKQSVSAESVRVHAAVTLASVEVVFSATGIPVELVLSKIGLRPSEDRSPHRNSYIAQKRDIVLIV
jgi:hypothetical protein